MIRIPGTGPLHRDGRPAPDLELDLAAGIVGVWAGSGNENIRDGTLTTARFAQPSGLATDGEHLFVADSEVSGVRVITGSASEQPLVRTIVGKGLFEFGDDDGQAAAGPAPALPRRGLRRREALHRRHLQQQDQGLRPEDAGGPDALVGDTKAGDSDNPPQFYEPGGLSVAGASFTSPTPTTTRSASSTSKNARREDPRARRI